MKILVGFDGSNSAKDALALGKNTPLHSMQPWSSYHRSPVEASLTPLKLNMPPRAWNWPKKCLRRTAFSVRPNFSYAA